MQKTKQSLSSYLWVAIVLAAFATLAARVVFPETLWATIAASVLLVASLGAMIYQNRKALQGRTAAYTFNSIVTVVLVVAIVGVLNFMASRYPQKLDLTKNKIHTLSDQSVKVTKSLKQPVKAIMFTRMERREQYRPLLDNFKAINPKFEVEYTDPATEPTRTKRLGIRKNDTLYLSMGAKDARVEDPSEEKLTNALIKLTKDKNQMLCFTTGHGEQGLSSTEPGGYEAFRRELSAQSYDTKEITIYQEGKIPDNCDGVAIMGPVHAFFDVEIKALREYLANGGHALIALNFNIKGTEQTPELLSLLSDWYIRSPNALIIDPFSRKANMEPSVPMVFSYSRDHAVTKDFFGQCFFAMSRPLEVVPGAPAGLNVTWVAQTTPNAWGETDLKGLAEGHASPKPGKTPMGPLSVVVAAEGRLKDSKAEKKTRLIVYGSEMPANNTFSRIGSNLDIFLNGATWIMGNDEFISIRTRENGPSRVDLSQRQQAVIFLITVLALPILIALGGIVIWVYRRRL